MHKLHAKVYLIFYQPMILGHQQPFLPHQQQQKQPPQQQPQQQQHPFHNSTLNMTSTTTSTTTTSSSMAPGLAPMTMTSTPSVASSQVQQQQQQQQQQQTQQQTLPPHSGDRFENGVPRPPPSSGLQPNQSPTTLPQTMSNTVQAEKSESSNPTTGDYLTSFYKHHKCFSQCFLRFSVKIVIITER